MKKLLSATFLVVTFLAYGQQDSLNMNLLGHLSYPSTDLSDIWGYADTAGNEYALVGAKWGFSVVDVTIPTNPVEKFFIPGSFSIWRDIKTYDHYAYVVMDQNGVTPDGILIVDMDSVNMPNPRFVKRYPSITIDSVTGNFLRAHNLYIDENGIMYLFGANIGSGGALMFDLKPDPWNPTYLGAFNENYLHDGMVRGDTLWGGAINTGLLQAIDVSNKQAPVIMGSKPTPNNFTHNVWVSDDNKTLYTTDERTMAYVAAYDVSDLANIEEVDKIKTSLGNNVIPHNTHVYGDYLVTSYYTSGVQIVDATYPDILVETGYYDTSPLNGNGFNGAWGAYPYLPSGNVLVSDIQEGLFIINSNYTKGCYFRCTVEGYVSGVPIPNAEINFYNSILDTGYTNIFGLHKDGIATPGLYKAAISASGYITDTIDFNMQPGVLIDTLIRLKPIGFSINEEIWNTNIRLVPNPSSGVFHIDLGELKDGLIKVEIMDISGAQLMISQEFDSAETIEITHNLPVGTYIVKAKSDSFIYAPKKLVVIE